eukprot:TRINITY_DN132821_c0_g1_i1.p1 TRINITY_DN132821_c0_g1~~TRINITY_DN132821_c0_g1_i1.p1  ORF type:complete len:226 (-),score=22.86 TRINITY_DN132821_c0_g1_i1:50-727(-)
MRKVNLQVLLLSAISLISCKLEKKEQLTKIKIPITTGVSARMNGCIIDSLDQKQLSEGVHLLDIRSRFLTTDIMHSFMLVKKDNKQIDFSILVTYRGDSGKSLEQRALNTFAVETLEELFEELQKHKEKGTVGLEFFTFKSLNGDEIDEINASTTKNGQYSIALKNSNENSENSSFTIKVNDTTYLVQLIGTNGDKIQKTVTIKEVKPEVIIDTSSIWYFNSEEK